MAETNSWCATRKTDGFATTPSLNVSRQNGYPAIARSAISSKAAQSSHIFLTCRKDNSDLPRREGRYRLLATAPQGRWPPSSLRRRTMYEPRRQRIVMASIDEREAVLELLAATLQKGGEVRPERTENLTNAKQLVVALLIGGVRLGRSIYLLLLNDLSDEARPLARTLLQDATTLAYLHSHEPDLEKLALGVLHASLVRQEALETAATSRGLKRPPDRTAQIQADMETVRQLAHRLAYRSYPDSRMSTAC
jgi:hypothetical protein